MITAASLKRAIAATVAVALSGCSTLETTLPPAPDKPAAAARARGNPAAFGRPGQTQGGGDILSNTEYGDSAFDVISRIKAAEIVSSGATDCGPVHTPVLAVRLRRSAQGRTLHRRRDGREGMLVASLRPLTGRSALPDPRALSLRLPLALIGIAFIARGSQDREDAHALENRRTCSCCRPPRRATAAPSLACAFSTQASSDTQQQTAQAQSQQSTSTSTQ